MAKKIAAVIFITAFILIFGCKKTNSPSLPSAAEPATPDATPTLTVTITSSPTITATATVTQTATEIAELYVSSEAILTEGTYYFSYVYLESGAVLNISGRVTIICSQYFQIDAGSYVNGTGKGYAAGEGPGGSDGAGGGGHGGAGGADSLGNFGPANDNPVNPYDMGSGGAAAAGGAFLKIIAPDYSLIDGQISVDGAGGLGTGAGGTVVIQSSSINGSGSIYANGGFGSGPFDNGGGGGGIVLFKCNNNMFTGSVWVKGGKGGSSGGYNGSDGYYIQAAY